MCGRYYRKSDKQKIAEAFHAHLVDNGTPNPPWDYNVAPTTIQPIIRNSRDTNEREVVSLRWGLVPFFTNDIMDVKGISTINARAETVATSRTYREPFKKRRCLVPADGFYEWKRLDPKNKQPFALDLLNGSMVAFAGLWDTWKDPANGQWLLSYTIITTDANETDGSGPRPDARHPPPQRLRPLARSRLRPLSSTDRLAATFSFRRDGSVRGLDRCRQLQDNSPELLNRHQSLPGMDKAQK